MLRELLATLCTKLFSNPEKQASSPVSQQARQMIALFGGTFDPIHNGHLGAVKALQNDLKLDLVRWLLSAQPPHKETTGATTEQRLAMLELALEDDAAMVPDETEINREGLSYTVLTLEQLRKESPDASLVLIIGADSMHSFHKWRRYEDIFGLCNIVVMRRPGYSLEPAEVMKPYLVSDPYKLSLNKSCCVLLYTAPEFPISSTKIRQQRKNNSSIEGLVPQSVERYIVENELYR